MKLSSGKRIGQSRQELATAVTFSFFLHVIFFFAAVFMYFTVKPRIYVPPLYDVKLVGPVADQTPVPQMPPAASKQEMQRPAKAKVKKAGRKEQKALKKGEMPDVAVKQKPSRTEEPKPADREEPASASTSENKAAARPEGNPESVGMPVAQQDFKYAWYLVRVRDKIGQNWNPPPDARDAKARVIFSVNRSGWVEVVNVVQDNSSGTYLFQAAAVRAIRASNPFPPLPEEFSKQTLEFTVDLMAID